ncbi:hypothetical protein [Lactococcus lactis]|uniref:hypothetical protein n=4 Tax=Bacteria TaxID=2 RepID=UPI00223ACD6F|nr:hypothetical protein [Lactococcus lactis]MCT0079986.1 hypothetical protein [Lactococcus lactis subsp. lactis]MCT0440192.1 hypothetical protein [Lactococcus lactis subsp. lactis]
MEEIITIIATLSGLGLVLLGLNKEIKEKKAKLLFVLSSNAILIGLNYFRGNIFEICLIMLLIFVCGGLGYLGQNGIDLEKELGFLYLFFFSSITVFLLTHQIFSLMYIIVLYIFSIYNPNWIDKNSLQILELAIGILIMFLQYLCVIKDYFNINYFKDTIEKWKPSIDNNISSLDNELQEEGYIERLGFVVFVEDKNFFERKQSHVTIRELMKKLLLKVVNIFRNNRIVSSSTQQRPVMHFFKKIKYYFRGYSTIEQQFIRRYALQDYSYRYKFRRKVLVEWIYTPLIMLSIRKRKSRIFSRSLLKRRRIKNTLTFSLKLSILCAYYKLILEDPKDFESLCSKLTTQSALSEQDIQFKYIQYKNSEKKSKIINSINEIVEDERYKF